MVASLDDAALEALSSKGLLRRAAADAAAGRVALTREDGEAAAFEIEGAAVHLSAGGLAKSRCSCPAPGICRHLLAAILWLRDHTAAAPATATVAWRDVIGAITEPELAEFAGPAAWRAALGADFADPKVTVTPHDRSLQVDFPGGDLVTFLSTGGLDAALCKTGARTRKARIAAAVLAARAALGLPAFSTPGQVAPAARVGNSLDLEDIRDFLKKNYFAALSLAPAAVEDEARRNALAGRVERRPRLAGLFKRIAACIAEMRQRTATADAGTLLALMAEAYALTIALDATVDQSAQGRLAGQVQQDYEEAGDLDLFGLGARRWEAPSGAHGVTTHFYAPAARRSLTVTLARPDRTDAAFHPLQAFQATPVWGLTMAEMSNSRVRLANAQISASGRLSSSAATSAVCEPWLAAPGVVAEWRCAFGDWADLETYLQTAFTARLGTPPVPDIPVILSFARRGGMRFDELTQTSLWPLADKHGRWIGLRLDYAGAERDRLLNLERLVETETFWAVLAIATNEDGRIDLAPYALWGDRAWLLDFMPQPKAAAPDPASWLERLRRAAGPRHGEPNHLALLSSATDALLDNAWNALLRQGERGQMAAPKIFFREAADLSRQFQEAGFPALANLFSAADRLTQEDMAAFCLRAAYAVRTTRSARARLAWMR